MIGRLRDWVAAIVSIAETRRRLERFEDHMKFYGEVSKVSGKHWRETMEAIRNNATYVAERMMEASRRHDALRDEFRNFANEEEKRVRHMIWQAKKRGRLK